MHPPLYISDGEVVIANRTANNNEENEGNEEVTNNNNDNENDIDKNNKIKSVSWVKTEYEDDDSSEKFENDNKKFVKFNSFSAMIEASNANNE